MQSTMFGVNNINVMTKKYSPKMAIITIVKAYLFMVLNRNFFMENVVSCSEMSFSEEPMEGMEIIEEFNELLNDNQEKNSLKQRSQHNSEGHSEKLNLNLIDQPLLPTTEKENFRKKYELNAIRYKLRECLDIKIPNIPSDLAYKLHFDFEFEKEKDEDIEILARFCDVVFSKKKIDLPENQIITFVKYREEFCEEKNAFFGKSTFKTCKMSDEINRLLSSIDSCIKEFEKIEVLKFYNYPVYFYEKIDESKIFSDAEYILEEIEAIADFVEFVKRENFESSISSKHKRKMFKDFDEYKKAKKARLE